MVNPAVIKAAAALLSNEKTRKGAGWIIVAILSPVILLIALLCSLGSGASSHNNAVVNLCFNGGMLPPDMYLRSMRICIRRAVRLSCRERGLQRKRCVCFAGIRIRDFLSRA